MSQCSDLLQVLSDGREHEMRDIHRAIGFCRLNSRVAELRSRGHNIVCDKSGGEYWYRLEKDAAFAGALQATGTGGNQPEAPAPANVTQLDLFGAAQEKNLGATDSQSLVAEVAA